MNLSSLRSSMSGRLELFAPAPAETIQRLKLQFAGFLLSEYVELLEESNGVGELFSEAGSKFVHNMLLFGVEDAISHSQTFGPGFLVVGAPGVDGVLYGLKPNGVQVFAYLPIDQEYVEVANSAQDLVVKWLANEVHL